MKDPSRTKAELIQELASLRQRIRELEHLESDRKRAEEALATAHRLLSSLLDAVPDLLLVVDKDYRIQYSNFKCYDLIDQPDVEKQKTCYGRFKLRDAPCEDCTTLPVFETGRSVEREMINPVDGHYREVRAFPIFNLKGQVEAVVEHVRDITERKTAEAALRKSEEKHRAFIESLPIGLYRNTPGPQGRFIMINTALARLHGFNSVEEFFNMNVLDLYVDPAQREEVSAELVEKGFVSGKEAMLKRNDGTSIWGSITARAIRDHEGKVMYFDGTVTDITDRKRAEEALKSSLSLLSASLESTADGILIVDRKGKIARWNQKFANMWKIPEEILSSRDDEKAINHILTQLADPEQFVAKIRKLYEQPEESSSDQIEFMDGRVFERYSQPQRIEDNTVGRVWSFRDITDRKRAEAEKVKLEEQYRQAQKMEAIGQLAGGIAHDFNNMLNIMLGYSQLALMKLEPHNPLHANIREIISAGRRSADLVRQLLAFARKQTIAPKALDINDTVAGMLNMLRKLIGEDIDLLWMPAANLWPVKMDPAQIDQIMANLAVNARDSISGVGKITIETGKAEFDETYCAQHAGFVPGQYVLLAVSDNGCGMDKETRGKIFEPFFTTKEIGKGTGMGLATVYGIVKQNNGFINVYSEPGKGATFKIYLPRRKDEGIVIDEPSTHAKPLTGTETVLLVEDNEALLKMGKMMLEELGYTVLAAGSPNEAFQLAEQYAGDIHLVLTDVVMPEMSGGDLQRRLSVLWPGLKFLFMSGYTANVIAHRGILDEGVHFLQKPFHMEELATKVREALEK